MVLIEYTNIVVDDFSEAKQRPFSHFIHFLTHMHTDHFNGLTDSWNLGVIYCSRITADLLTHKFPKLSSIVHPL
jgi:phosphoribosyl 1,2-cyclic phosphodiesterase